MISADWLMRMPKDKRAGSMLLQLFLACTAFSSFVDKGNAGVTSTFIRTEWPSIDIPLDNEAFVISPGYNAPQQVHITQGDYDGKAVIISWVTPDKPGSNNVRYGTSEKKYDFTASGTVQKYTFYNYTSGYIHHCFLSNLKEVVEGAALVSEKVVQVIKSTVYTHLYSLRPKMNKLDSHFGTEYDTKYFYEIGDGASARLFSFQTPPKIGPDAPYKFGIIGDLGQTYNSLFTLEHYTQSGGQTVLFVGDLSYADQYKYHDVGVRWDTWGRLVESIAAYQPWMWTAGNHEIEYMPDMGEVTPFKSYLYRYATPYAASKSSNPLWYAIRRAAAHIIVLSSYSPFVKSTPQWIWLDKEFQRVDREKTPWLIVLMHAPIYNSNDAHYMEGESMRAVFERWFVQYKVDVVFAGHVHAYERSYRISNINYNVSIDEHYPVPDKFAPVYITVGDGGNREGLASRFRDPQPDYSAFREASYGHSTLEILNRTHALYHWNRNDDGKKVTTDAFMLHNQYWRANGRRRRKLKKNYLHRVVQTIPLRDTL